MSYDQKQNQGELKSVDQVKEVHNLLEKALNHPRIQLQAIDRDTMASMLSVLCWVLGHRQNEGLVAECIDQWEKWLKSAHQLDVTEAQKEGIHASPIQ